MASGLAVIGADAGGVGEIITHGQNGLKFPQRNSDELTNCMATLIDDVDLRDDLKINGRIFSLTRSWDKICDGLNVIYHEIIEKRKILFLVLKIAIS